MAMAMAMALTLFSLFSFSLFLHHSFIPVLASSSPPNATLLLEDLLKEIAAKQRWDLGEVKLSRLDLRRFRFGASRRYEFRVGLGPTHLSAIFSDHVSSWKKFKKPRTDFASVLDEARSLAVLDEFKVDGPFELRVSGDGDDGSLLLPMNRTYTGFKRILVGEGITVKVRGAREVSAFQTSDIDSTVNRSNVAVNDRSDFWPIWHSFCRPLVQIQVFGSASFVAYRTRNPDHYIETNQILKETIELLAEKCYGSPVYKKRACPVDALSSRISTLEKVLKSYFGKHTRGLVGIFRGKVNASAIIRFQLEVKGSNVTQQAIVGWRTKSNVGRVWFDILAGVENKSLKLLMAKKIKPPFISDSVLWSDLSNISFTKLPSLLVPSEALTLDVKW